MGEMALNQQLSRARMAAYLAINPTTPETWPVELLDWLIELEKMRGREALCKELNEMMTPP